MTKAVQHLTTFDQYDHWIQKLKTYPSEFAVPYCALKLCGEAGEVAEKIGKEYRDRNGAFLLKERIEIIKELGDVLWYITALANEVGFSLEEVVEFNRLKLEGRLAAGTLKGDGDNR